MSDHIGEGRKPRQSQSLSVLPALPEGHGPPTSTPTGQNPTTNASATQGGLYPRSLARYQRIRALATGGNGEVDIWHDQDIDRNVAVKRLKLQRSQTALAQFISEVHTVGQLEHPGIVPIYDVGIDEDNNYFFVMKHVEGETLEQVIAKLQQGDPIYKRRYSYEVRSQIFMQILRAVQYAHGKGYLHCDIKPAEIFSVENRV